MLQNESNNFLDRIQVVKSLLLGLSLKLRAKLQKTYRKCADSAQPSVLFIK